MDKNIVFDSSYLSTSKFETLLQQKGALFWFTGLSGSGKSTLAKSIQNYLFSKGRYIVVLDGDNIRHGLNSDLDFSTSGRKENIRRIAEVAKLFVTHGALVITAFISPYRKDREQAKAIVGEDRFFEIFIDTPLEVCIQRDPKNLYSKALKGEILQFTGVSDPYEVPATPELTLQTSGASIQENVDEFIQFLELKGLIPL